MGVSVSRSDKNIALVIGAIISVAIVITAGYAIFSPSDSNAEQNMIPAWLAEGAVSAEKIYADDNSGNYDYVVDYSNGSRVTIHCSPGFDETVPRELPRNNFEISCGPKL